MKYVAAMKLTLGAAVAAALLSTTAVQAEASASEHATPVAVTQHQYRVVLWAGECVHQSRHRTIKQYGAPGYTPRETGAVDPGDWTHWRVTRVDHTFGC